MLLMTAAWGATTGHIRGHVWDMETGEPVSDAQIIVEGTGISGYSDHMGRYKLGPLPYAMFSLEVRHIGYQSTRAHVQLSGIEIEQDFYLQPRVLEADEVVITADRAIRGVTPVTFTDLSQALLQRENVVQDIPMMLEQLVPGLYSYSDAGNGVGYSYLKIRGFDQKRINVMINGIPLNDPEDHQVYWVDMPDLIMSLQDVQVQRGVGTALVGQSGIGGSVNMLTTQLPAKAGIQLNGGLGSWGTRKFAFEIGSKSERQRAMYVRFSRVVSDGYRDRTSSDMWSYFFGAQAARGDLLARFNAYGGPIKTHAGWYAAHEDSLDENRRFNPVVYDNEIDSFNQPHFEFHLGWDHSENITLGSSLFYIRGNGYYEQFKEDRELRDYGIVPVDDDSTEADLIRQKKVKKDHVGWIPRVDWTSDNLEASAGGELSYYRGKHWGRVLDVLPHEDYPDVEHGTYYRYRGEKVNASGFLHLLTHLGSRLDLLTDLSIQRKHYSFRQEEAGNFTGALLNRFEDNHTFVSPRGGLTFRPWEGVATYFNVSLARREPADEDYFDVWDGPDDLFVTPLFANSDTSFNGSGAAEWVEWTGPQIEPERLIDYEAGVQVKHGKLNAGVALYLMQFEDEIVPYGQFDYDRGAPVTGNAPKTEHKGVELDLSLRGLQSELGEFSLSGHFSLSDDVFKEFTSYESWDDEGENLEGNPIPLFPEKLLTVRADYKRDLVGFGARIRHVGKQYLDTSGDESRVVDPYTLIGVALSFGPIMISGGGRASVELRIDNLFDEEHKTSGYYDSYEGARYYWVGAERTVYLGLKLDL
jgi:iron complex outermembrane receptor protein